MALRNPAGPRPALIPFFILLGSLGVADPDIATDGVVRYLNVDGGRWAIEAGNDRYEPANLPAEFRVDGLRVRFEASDQGEAGRHYMVGRLVELEYIQVAA